ncbi:hypothetical protein [Brevundimonas sp.]
MTARAAPQGFDRFAEAVDAGPRRPIVDLAKPEVGRLRGAVERL